MVAKADIKVKLIPDFSQFKKELNGIVNGAAKGKGGTGAKKEGGEEKKKGKESTRILDTLKKSLKFLGVIALVTTLIGGIFKIFEPVIKLLGVVLTLLFVPLIPIMKQVLISLGEFAKKAAGNVADLLTGEINLTEFFENVFGDVGTLIEEVTPIITEFIERVMTALSNVILENTGSILKFILKFIGNIGLVLLTALGIIVKTIALVAFKFGGKIGEELAKFIKNIKPTLSKMLLKIKDKIKTAWSNWINGIKNTLSNIKDRIKTAWTDFIDNLKSAINTVIDRIKNFFSFGSRRGSNETNVGDAIIRPNGQIIRTDPKDTLIATKNPEDLARGGSFTFAPVINLPGQINSTLDVRNIAEEIARIGFEELNRRTNGTRI